MEKIILVLGKRSLKNSFYYQLKKKYQVKIVFCSYNPHKKVNFILERGQELKQIKEFTKDKEVIAVVNNVDATEILHGKLVDYFKVPGPSYRAVRLFKDKVRLHRKIIKHNLAFYRPITLVSNLDDLKEDLRQVQFPVVIKPFAGAKSRGVFRLDKMADLAEVYPLLERHFASEKSMAIRESKMKKLLVEQYVKGKVVTVEGYVDSEGKLHPVFFTDVVTAQDLKLPHMQHVYRTTPSDKNEHVRKRIEFLLRRLVKISKLKSTFIHPEFFVVGKRVYLIELNVRIGGYRSQLANYAYGLSLEKLAFKLALGEKIKYEFKYIKSATVCEVWEEEDKKVKEIIWPKRNKYLVRFSNRYSDGELYQAPPIGNRALATFYTLSEEDSIKEAKKIRKKLKILTEG